MSEHNGRIGKNVPNAGHDQTDMFCRTVVAAVAAMLALRICQYLRRYIGMSVS